MALIAAYERGIPWMQAGAETPRGARVALWGGREIATLIVMSLAAGCATMPYVGYHFHRLGPYGVIANVLAMPIVSVLVMPAGLLAHPRHPVRSRRAAVAADGARHRLDDLGGAVRGGPAGRGRAHRGVRDRAAAAVHGGSAAAVSAALALALVRRRRDRGGGVLGVPHAGAGRLCRQPRRCGRGARGLGQAVGDAHRCRRHLPGARMARGGCRRADTDRSIAQGWRDLRRDRLRRAAARRRDRGAAVRGGSLRGGLPPCGARREPAHRAAVVRRDGHRPHGVAAHGSGGALSDRKRVGEGGGVSARL